MEFVNICLCIILLGLVGFEAKRTFTTYSECKKAMNDVKSSKEDVVEYKDYTTVVSIYGSIIIIVLALGIFLVIIKEYLAGIMLIELSLLWVNFIIDSICSKTYLFYDTGFLYCGKQYKYRNVLSIDDNKKFLRGYRVKMSNTNEDEVYVTKTIRPILEHKIKEHKNRKKK